MVASAGRTGNVGNEEQQDVNQLEE